MQMDDLHGKLVKRLELFDLVSWVLLVLPHEVHPEFFLRGLILGEDCLRVGR